MTTKKIDDENKEKLFSLKHADGSFHYGKTTTLGGIIVIIGMVFQFITEAYITPKNNSNNDVVEVSKIMEKHCSELSTKIERTDSIVTANTKIQEQILKRQELVIQLLMLHEEDITKICEKVSVPKTQPDRINGIKHIKDVIDKDEASGDIIRKNIRKVRE